MATAQFFEFADRLARTAREEKEAHTRDIPRCAPSPNSCRPSNKKITRLDEVIRENGGVIDDK